MLGGRHKERGLQFYDWTSSSYLSFKALPLTLTYMTTMSTRKCVAMLGELILPRSTISGLIT